MIKVPILNEHENDQSIDDVLDNVHLIHCIKEVTFFVLEKLVEFELNEVQIQNGDQRKLDCKEARRIEKSELLAHGYVNVRLK